MAHSRRQSMADVPKEPHLVSLKVLRLSRPSLADQHPLPHGIPDISPLASLAYPFKSSDTDFVLSPNLALPLTFGSAHVGETFACTLCANNELPLDGSPSRTVSNIRIVSEMQTPTQSIPLELHGPSETELPLQGPDSHTPSQPGSSLQQTIRFDLKEEGSHVLAVNVSYTETANLHPAQSQPHPLSSTTLSSQIPTTRPRSFRKLYQFVAQPCLSVRTKATELSTFGPSSLLSYALEAQLENVGDSVIVLEEARLQARSPFKTTPLNWNSNTSSDNPKLAPRDVMQVAFLLEQQEGVTDGLDELNGSLNRDGRAVLGQLAIEWRSAMGEKGFLSTGNLLTRRK